MIKVFLVLVLCTASGNLCSMKKVEVPDTKTCYEAGNRAMEAANKSRTVILDMKCDKEVWT